MSFDLAVLFALLGLGIWFFVALVLVREHKQTKTTGLPTGQVNPTALPKHSKDPSKSRKTKKQASPSLTDAD
jgi:hypothetical protein